MDSKSLGHSVVNRLNPIAGATSLFLGLFLMLGAVGHLIGVWPLMLNEPMAIKSILFLLPGWILAMTSLANISLCAVLWVGKNWAKKLAFFVNLFTALYLVYLMSLEIPEHPIGVFLAHISSQTILLGVMLLGLAWPLDDIGRG